MSILVEINPLEEVLKTINIPNKTGLLWDQIETFKQQILGIENAVGPHKAGTPQEEDLKELLPLKQHLEGGLYTRELFMPKSWFLVSMIHKQKHPTFLVKGEVSYLTDDGKIARIKAPHSIFTKEGAQRILYIHEDSILICVFKTNAKTFLEAEADVFVDNYRELPKEILKEKTEQLLILKQDKELC